VAGKARDVRADTGRFKLDIAGQQFVEMDGVVRTTEAVEHVRFAGTDDLPAQHTSGVSHQILEGSAQLVFRLAMGGLAHLGLDGLGERLKGFLDRHSLDYVRITL